MFVDSTETNLLASNQNAFLSTPSFDSDSGKYKSTVNVDEAIDFTAKLIITSSQFTNKKGEAV